MNERQTLTDEEKIAFSNLCKEYKNSFLLFDQISRKYSAEIYQLKRTVFLTAIFFEVEKIKTFLLNLHEKIQKWEIISYRKNFLCNFFVEKNPQIMHSTEFYHQVREVLAMLFESLKILERHKQYVMSNLNIPTGQKDAFLFYYKLKLEETKAEFEAIEKIA